MTTETKTPPPYEGFEQGPIRPPSEANSLLLRLTRNCPWNRCSFCPVYKKATFSLRPPEHVLRDIDAVHCQVLRIREYCGAGESLYSAVQELERRLAAEDRQALYAAANWLEAGMRSVFLQDGDSLVLKPAQVIAILRHLHDCFPEIERVTSYARSKTIDRIAVEDLAEIAAAGLNRIHIGMESGADAVLALVNKGTDQATHIRAGLKVRQAGMELSEYVMPGLGGRALSREHALETAEALNQINPDFIRLRTLAIPRKGELFEAWSDGRFEKLGDREVAAETLLMLESLDGITSTLKSDHILNLFQDAEGRYPQDKPRITGIFRHFLALPPEEQVIYQVGRRNGLFARLDDLHQEDRRRQAEQLVARHRVTPDNVDAYVVELMKRFV